MTWSNCVCYGLHHATLFMGGQGAVTASIDCLHRVDSFLQQFDGLLDAQGAAVLPRAGHSNAMQELHWVPNKRQSCCEQGR